MVSTCALPGQGVGVADLTFGTVTSCAMAENTSSACGWANWTRALSSGHGWFGAVRNWTFLLDRWCRLSPMLDQVETVMPVSVVIWAAASVTTLSSRSGFDSRPLLSTSFTTCADMNWSRWIRSRSDPVPMSSRVRQKASAWMPLMWCSPAGRLRPDTGSFTLYGTQTLTPPRSLTTLTKPSMPIPMKWLMKMPVCCSTVFHRHTGPPISSSALICT